MMFGFAAVLTVDGLVALTVGVGFGATRVGMLAVFTGAFEFAGMGVEHAASAIKIKNVASTKIRLNIFSPIYFT